MKLILALSKGNSHACWENTSLHCRRKPWQRLKFPSKGSGSRAYESPGGSTAGASAPAAPEGEGGLARRAMCCNNSWRTGTMRPHCAAQAGSAACASQTRCPDLITLAAYLLGSSTSDCSVVNCSEDPDTDQSRSKRNQTLICQINNRKCSRRGSKLNLTKNAPTEE